MGIDDLNSARRGERDLTYKFAPVGYGQPATRKCERCGAVYTPNSRAQKYCDTCKSMRVR